MRPERSRTAISADAGRITVSGIEVDVVRKRIKNLRLSVSPPDGRVRIAVPLHVDDDAVRVAVGAKIGWIRRHQTRLQDQGRQPVQRMVSGECHHVGGQAYRLRVVEEAAPPRVSIHGGTLELRVRPESDRAKRLAVLEGWYRERLRGQVADLIAVWEPRMGVTVAEFGIKRMRTRWGTCNQEAGRIWLGLELAKKPPGCVEYVVVHEMVHLLERGHGQRFRDLMDRYLPQWRSLRDQLNRPPPPHEDVSD